jgi:hypothetical protein
MSTSENHSDELLADDLIWGIRGKRGIAAELGLPPGRVYYLVSRGAIPVRKLGHKSIVASRSELRAFLRGEVPE